MKAALEKAKQTRLNRRKLNEMVKVLSKLKKCQAVYDAGEKDSEGYCDSSFPVKIYATNGKVMYKNGKEEEEQEMSAEYCWELLGKMKPEEAKELGFTRESMPRDLIIKSLLVGPP